MTILFNKGHDNNTFYCKYQHFKRIAYDLIERISKITVILSKEDIEYTGIVDQNLELNQL